MNYTVRQIAGIASAQVALRRDPRSRDETGFRYVRDRCESPIEVAYCLALFQAPGVRGRSLDRVEQVIDSRSRARFIYVFAQCPILHYRVDFLLIGKNVPKPLFLIIECDGADYHSAEADAERDGQLEEQGFAILRFRGWEIYEHPTRVIAETLGRFDLPPAPMGSIYFAIWQLRQAVGSVDGELEREELARKQRAREELRQKIIAAQRKVSER